MPEWVEVPFKVQRPQEGLRLDQFLSQRLHKRSRAEIQKIVALGQVFLRGKEAKSAQRLQAGETVLIRYPKHDEPTCPHESLPILYEDDSLLALDKPAGVLSHPTDRIVDNAATSIVKKQFSNLRLYLLHRLDRETSGVLLFTKTARAARELSAQFLRRDVQKEYRAIVRGEVSWPQKTVDVPLGREGGEIKVRQAAGRGLPATTEFARLRSGAGISLVSAKPKTGRLHQIRAHLAYLGHPIVGDKLYTGDGEIYMKTVRREVTAEDLAQLGAPRQMLHAAKLSLKTAEGSDLEIESPLPDDFRKLLDIMTANANPA